MTFAGRIGRYARTTCRAATWRPSGLRLSQVLPWALVAVVLAGQANARSLPFAPGVRIIPPAEVLSSYTDVQPDGALLFREAGGGQVKLITAIDDPEITNRGDGVFHPAGEQEVYEALSQIRREFLSSLEVKIFLLPYPRSGRLSSSADDGAIYLSPGVREYEPWQVAYLVTHEIGHLVHRRFLPDSLATAWQEWATLRGVADSSVYHSGAEHANRPREIFAEDFRALFGGADARRGGTIENQTIARPDEVPGLEGWYLALVGIRTAPSVAELNLHPNPMRAGQRLTLRLPSGAAAKSASLSAGLYDIGGRRVSEVRFQRDGEGLFAGSWDGRGEEGRGLASGAYWLRVESLPTPVVLPVRVVR